MENIAGMIISGLCTIICGLLFLLWDLKRKHKEVLKNVIVEYLEKIRVERGLSQHYEHQCDKWSKKYYEELNAHADTAVIKNKIQSEARRWKKAFKESDRRAMAQAFVKRIGRISLMKGREGAWNVRFKVIESELKELRSALYCGNKTAYLDALGDIAYAAEVTAYLLNVDMDDLFARIHNSNMTKDAYLFSKDGKGKGPDFKAPDLSDLA